MVWILPGRKSQKTHFRVMWLIWLKEYKCVCVSVCVCVSGMPTFPNNWAASLQNQENDCAPSEDSDQPGHPPRLIRGFAVRIKKAWVLSYPLRAQRRLWSDWADAQAELSLRWAHMPFCWFCHVAAEFCFNYFKPCGYLRSESPGQHCFGNHEQEKLLFHFTAHCVAAWSRCTPVQKGHVFYNVLQVR